MLSGFLFVLKYNSIVLVLTVQTSLLMRRFWKKPIAIYIWRLMNEYFLFERWKLAVAALQQGADLYGTNYQKIFDDKYRLLGMNFFWFRSDYVAKLAKLYVAKDCRNLSEVRIYSKTHNVYCPFEFSGNSRNTAIAHEFYDREFSIKKVYLTINVYFAKFSF